MSDLYPTGEYHVINAVDQPTIGEPDLPPTSPDWEDLSQYDWRVKEAFRPTKAQKAIASAAYTPEREYKASDARPMKKKWSRHDRNR